MKLSLGGGLGVLNERVPLARWSELLLDEIFGDREGEGRPVTTIDADEALLSRALARADLHASHHDAFEAFKRAFPNRQGVLRWFSGVEAPGEALVAFLVLCCLAASDIVEADKEDYRGRLQAMMGWDRRVTDCKALPGLWLRLAEALERAERGKWRPLVLPDPDFRTQIGHAIELTFPSRRDTRRLRQELEAGGLADPRHPVAVLRWVGPRVAHYSPSFATTFADFQAAWRAGDRALVDHRFWTGWCKAIDHGRTETAAATLDVRCDEWGRHELVDADGEAVTLERLARETRTPPALRTALAAGTPIFLREIDWGLWTWCGADRYSVREATAALFREKSYSAALRAQFNPSPVEGADGWAFTTCTHLLSTNASLASFDEDDLIDARLSGPPRVEGGWLARPSFPIRISTRGLVGDVALAGGSSQFLRLERNGPSEWAVTPLAPLEGQATVRVASGVAGASGVVRHVALRRTITAPDLDRPLPARYAFDEPATPGWSATFEGPPTSVFASEPVERRERPDPAQALLDLIEYFAARPAPMSLGGLCELVMGLGASTHGQPWSIIRALLEGGLLDPVRARGGWRGAAVAPRAPRGVLARAGQGHRLTFDGLLNEAWLERAGNIARRHGSKLEINLGPSAWSVPTTSADGELPILVSIAEALTLPLAHLSPDLSGLTTPRLATPNANVSGHPRRQNLTADLGRHLESRGVSMFHCRREKDNGPRLWLVITPQGEERAWLQRHLALLDAHVLAGLAAFELSPDRALMTAAEAMLPLDLARWLRLATGQAPGPVGRVHAYPTTARVVGPLQSYLGGLLAVTAQPGKPDDRPRRASGGVLAVGRGDEISTRQVWRWARERKGAVV